MKQESEAMQISKKIFYYIKRDINRDGAKFTLFILPTQSDLEKLRQSEKYRDDWDKMAETFCGSTANCIDLSRDLLNMEKNQRDNGYDGTHFGPETNRQITKYIRNHLERMNLLW